MGKRNTHLGGKDAACLAIRIQKCEQKRNLLNKKDILHLQNKSSSSDKIYIEDGILLEVLEMYFVSTNLYFNELKAVLNLWTGKPVFEQKCDYSNN